MPRPSVIELGEGRELSRIPILFEDRSVIAIDKPAGWMLVPFTWQTTRRNLPAAITSSIKAGDFWAKSRNLKMLRNVHRLDAETTGILLWVKSIGAVRPFSDLFKSRRIRKTYLAVVDGIPKSKSWTCRDALARDPDSIGRMQIDRKQGQEAETHFRVIETIQGKTLIEARPITGRTHQIRVHLLQARCPIVGDTLYHPEDLSSRSDQIFPMGLRAVALEYPDPFQRKPVRIHAPADTFLRSFGFAPTAWTHPRPDRPDKRSAKPKAEPSKQKGTTAVDE